MKYLKYGLVLANFPFTDLSKSKKRPCLVIKDLEGRNVIVCQLTTKRHSLTKYEIALKRNHCNGDIRFDSFIYVDLIVTLHKSLIDRKIGFVKDEAVKKQINDKLKLLLID